MKMLDKLLGSFAGLSGFMDKTIVKMLIAFSIITAVISLITASFNFYEKRIEEAYNSGYEKHKSESLLASAKNNSKIEEFHNARVNALLNAKNIKMNSLINDFQKREKKLNEVIKNARKTANGQTFSCNRLDDNFIKLFNDNRRAIFSD